MMPLAPICHPGFPIIKVSAPHPIQMAKKMSGYMPVEIEQTPHQEK